MGFTVTVSSKGQLVIPSEIRKKAGINEGDILEITLGENGQVNLKKTKTLDEISEHLTSLIKPGIPPLEDSGTFYSTREPRL